MPKAKSCSALYFEHGCGSEALESLYSAIPVATLAYPLKPYVNSGPNPTMPSLCCTIH